MNLRSTPTCLDCRVGLVLVPLVMGQAPATERAAARPQGERPPAKAQPRPHGERVKVDPSRDHGRGRRRRHHPLERQGLPRSSGSWASTRRRSGASSTTCRTTSPSAPRRGRSPRGHSPPRPRSSCSARRPSIPTAGRSLTCSSTAGTTPSWCIKAGYTTETVSHYGDNGLPRESAEVVAAAKAAAPAAVRAAPSVPGPDAHADRHCAQASNGQYPEN